MVAKKDSKKNIKKVFLILIILIMLIAIVIGVPIFINMALYWRLETNSTTDSDWLSFWGSFLGGILGGIATLLGVLLSIFKMNRDKQEEEEKKYPYIIPLELKELLKKYDKNVVNSFNLIEVVNLGMQHALNISLESEKLNYDLLKEWSLENKINILEKGIFNQCIEMLSKSITKIQVIISSDGNKIYSMKMPMMMEFIINFIVVNLIDNYYVKYRNYDNIPLCYLIFRFKNNHGKDINNRYFVYMNCFMCESEDNEKQCLSTILFKLQEEK